MKIPAAPVPNATAVPVTKAPSWGWEGDVVVVSRRTFCSRTSGWADCGVIVSTLIPIRRITKGFYDGVKKPYHSTNRQCGSSSFRPSVILVPRGHSTKLLQLWEVYM